MEERELIKRAAKGEGGAFDEIVRRYQDGLFRHLLRLTGRAEEAEDLCQETFIRFYGALRRFNPHRPIAPYLFTIATNLGRTRAARAGAQMQPFEQQAGEASVAEQALARLEYQQILAAVKQLRPEQQEAVSLYYDQGLSYREIAHITKVPVGTVSTRLRLALGALRQALAAGLVIPAGLGDLPQYLTSVLQGQATAPGSIIPAVTHGISTLAPASAGVLTLWKGAVVMNKAIYVAIGLAVVGGAVVEVPRLLNHSSEAQVPGRVERAKTTTNLSLPSPKSVSRQEGMPSRAPENPSPIAKTTTNLQSPSPKSGSRQAELPASPAVQAEVAKGQDQYRIVLGPTMPGISHDLEKRIDELRSWLENLSPQDTKTLIEKKRIDFSLEQVRNSYPEKIKVIKAHLERASASTKELAEANPNSPFAAHAEPYTMEKIKTVSFNESMPGQYDIIFKFDDGRAYFNTLAMTPDQAKKIQDLMQRAHSSK